jgi:hypothetical protein
MLRAFFQPFGDVLFEAWSFVCNVLSRSDREGLVAVAFCASAREGNGLTFG